MFDFLQSFADWVTFSVLDLVAGSHLAETVNFFVYDFLKVMLLLFVVIFLMGWVNAYFPVEKLKKVLARNRFYGLEYVLASSFGAVTPFCSCSSVPLFIGFVQGGIPLGVTFSFLITSPLINEVALALFIGMFGWEITLVYLVSGIVLGTLGGVLLQKLNLERYLTDWVKQLIDTHEIPQAIETADKPAFRTQLSEVFRNATSIVKSVALYVVIGIAIGAGMHGYVSEAFFQDHFSGEEWWTVPLAVVIAIPMYSNAAGVVPIIQVLVAKGVPLGTALAFMMSIIGVSLPEATLLKKVMSFRLIGIFFGVVATFIILLGFLFNWIF